MSAVKSVSGCEPSRNIGLSRTHQGWGRGWKGKEAIRCEINHPVQPVLPHLSREEDVKELITMKEPTVILLRSPGARWNSWLPYCYPPRTAGAGPAGRGRIWRPASGRGRGTSTKGSPLPGHGQEPFLWPPGKEERCWQRCSLKPIQDV